MTSWSQWFLNRVLAMAAYGGLVTVLRALLSCRLPLDLSTRDRLGRSLQVLAVGGTSAPENMQATVRLLHAAGAPLEADALLHAVDRRCGAGVEALLACGRPAVDTSRSWLAVFGRDRYSCPVHRVLQGLAMQVRPARHGAAPHEGRREAVQAA